MTEKDANEGLLTAARHMLEVLEEGLGAPGLLEEVPEFVQKILAARAILRAAVAAKMNVRKTDQN